MPSVEMWPEDRANDHGVHVYVRVPFSFFTVSRLSQPNVLIILKNFNLHRKDTHSEFPEMEATKWVMNVYRIVNAL